MLNVDVRNKSVGPILAATKILSNAMLIHSPNRLIIVQNETKNKFADD